MNPIEPRAQATLDAAMNLIRTAAASAAMRVAESLTVAAQNATKISERDQLVTTQQELRRNLGSFQSAFFESLREKVAKELAPRVDNKSKLESADWQTLSLVDEKEVEEQMNFVRLGQMISHECEWQLRDLAAYMGALLNLGSADDERNPLRAEIVGAALHRGIEAISGERESRRILARELGQAVAHAMPECYDDILRLLQERGVRPVHLTVRTVEGPGNQLGGANSGYASLPRDGHASSRGGAYGEIESNLRAGQRHGPARRAPARPGDGVPRPRRADRQRPRRAARGARQQRRARPRQRRRRPAADDPAAAPDRDRQPARRARPSAAGWRASWRRRRAAAQAPAGRAATPARATPAAAASAAPRRARSRRAAASAPIRRAARRRWATAAAAASTATA